MSLKVGVESYLGQRLYVEPFFGWGWSRLDPGAPDLTIEQSAGPPPFHVRVERFYTHRSELRGAIGIVEEQLHLCNGLYVVFYTRGDNLDFEINVGAYNIIMGPEEPISIEVSELEELDWPRWNMEGSPVLNGYAVIGGNEQTVRNYYKRREQSKLVYYL